MTSSDDSDALEAAYLIAMVLGVCFSALIMGMEAAVGGAVSTPVELAPGLLTVLVVFMHAWASNREVESNSERREPSEL